MVKPSFDELLQSSKQRFEPSKAASDALEALAVDLQAESARLRDRRVRGAIWLVPTSLIAVGALTGGAVLFAQYMSPDVRVAVGYETETGIDVGMHPRDPR